MANLKSIGNVIFNFDCVKCVEILEKDENGRTKINVRYTDSTEDVFYLLDNSDIATTAESVIKQF